MDFVRLGWWHSISNCFMESHNPAMFQTCSSHHQAVQIAVIRLANRWFFETSQDNSIHTIPSDPPESFALESLLPPTLMATSRTYKGWRLETYPSISGESHCNKGSRTWLSDLRIRKAFELVTSPSCKPSWRSIRSRFCVHSLGTVQGFWLQETWSGDHGAKLNKHQLEKQRFLDRINTHTRINTWCKKNHRTT